MSKIEQTLPTQMWFNYQFTSVLKKKLKWQCVFLFATRCFVDSCVDLILNDSTKLNYKRWREKKGIRSRNTILMVLYNSKKWFYFRVILKKLNLLLVLKLSILILKWNDIIKCCWEDLTIVLF